MIDYPADKEAEDNVKSLLSEALRYLKDGRLYYSEVDGRRRRETAQQHADRISSEVQENEDLRALVDEIEKHLEN
jgi:hypothetical protein